MSERIKINYVFQTWAGHSRRHKDGGRWDRDSVKKTHWKEASAVEAV
jgi:hypothetical protein